MLDWRLSIKSVLVLVVIEGAIRKWLVPELSDLVYFVKDIILFGVYIRYFLLPAYYERRVRVTNDHLLLANVYLFFMWGLVQSFNPKLGSPVVGLFGLKAYLFYIPLMWIVPNLFRSREDLINFLWRYLLLLIPVGILGIVQFFSPATSLLNVYAGGRAPGAYFALGYENVRITATFPYLTGYTSYLTICLCLIIPLLNLRQSLTWRIVLIVELILVVVTSFMTGARSIMIFGVLFGGIYIILLSGKKFSEFFVNLRYFILIGCLIVIVISTTKLQSAFNAFSARATVAGDSILDRIIGEFTVLSDTLQLAKLGGLGIGGTHQAVPALRQTLHLPDGDITATTEGEMGRVLLETGAIGAILWYFLRIYILIRLWQLLTKSRESILKNLILSVLLTQTILLMNTLVFNNSYAIYYWFLNGLIFLIPLLEESEEHSHDLQVPKFNTKFKSKLNQSYS